MQAEVVVEEMHGDELESMYPLLIPQLTLYYSLDQSGQGNESLRQLHSYGSECSLPREVALLLLGQGREPEILIIPPRIMGLHHDPKVG